MIQSLYIYSPFTKTPCHIGQQAHDVGQNPPPPRLFTSASTFFLIKGRIAHHATGQSLNRYVRKVGTYYINHSKNTNIWAGEDYTSDKPNSVRPFSSFLVSTHFRTPSPGSPQRAAWHLHGGPKPGETSHRGGCHIICLELRLGGLMQFPRSASINISRLPRGSFIQTSVVSLDWVANMDPFLFWSFHVFPMAISSDFLHHFPSRNSHLWRPA